MAATKEPLTLARGNYFMKMSQLCNSIVLDLFLIVSECCFPYVADVERAIELLNILQESEYFRTFTTSGCHTHY